MLLSVASLSRIWHSRSRHGQTSVHVAVTGKHLLRSHKGLSLSIAEKFLEIALSGLAVILLLALGYARRTGGDQLSELLNFQLTVHGLDRLDHRFLPDPFHLNALLAPFI